MEAVFFRHGDKENEHTDDPPLSALGHAQAHGLSELVRRNILPSPSRLFASEKVRTRQTLQILQSDLRIPQTSTKELNPKMNGETTPQFLKRVQLWLNRVQEMDGCVFACTHVDVMSAILIAMGESEGEFMRSGGYVHAHFNDSHWIIQLKGTLHAHS